MPNLLSQRDVFINALFDLSESDPDIVFLSADFGAPALDRFRQLRARQFFHLGISEQNMIDVAAGMALGGLKPFVYAMGPFISMRCLEQIKCSLAQMNQPVTILSVGNGLGYADAGPTHYSTEDYACLRAIVGLEIFTPSDNGMVEELARMCVDQPALRCIRLDRTPIQNLSSSTDNSCLNHGFRELRRGEKVCVISNGYALSKAWDVINQAGRSDVGMVDLFASEAKDAWLALVTCLKRYEKLIVFEENTPSGALGSQVLEILADFGISNILIRRQHLEKKYFYENIGRDNLMKRHGLSEEKLLSNLEV